MRQHSFSYFAIFVAAMGLLFPVQLFAVSNDPYVMQDAYELIGVYDAWQYTTGSREVVVAVIDNGFDHYHPDLIENVWYNLDEIPGNGIDDDNNGYIDDIVGWNFVPEDLNNDGEITGMELRGNNNPRPSLDASDTLVSGHGTAVAGLIGATGYNGLLGAGLNWRVSLMNLKIVGNTGNGTIQYVPEAIRYAVDNGADVISMSIVGFADAPDVIREAVQYAYEHDVVVVAAAGNNLRDLNTTPVYPICSDATDDIESIIGVSAISPRRAFARFSNYGSNCIDITAPGIDISSTVGYSQQTTALAAQYRGELQGTSFATPLVSGTAALIRSLFPELSAAQVIEAILTSVDKTPPQDEILYENLFGAGLLQVSAALEKASELASTTIRRPYALEYAVTIPISKQVTLSYDKEHDGVLYHINDIPVRYIPAATQVAAVAIHPSTDEVYVLEEPNTFGQIISVYNQLGTGIQQVHYASDRGLDGIFFKDDILHGYRIHADSVDVYQLHAEGEFVLDTVIHLPNVSLVGYSEDLSKLIGVQYERVLFAWTQEQGISTQVYVPMAFGPSIHLFALNGQDIISFHDDIATVWNGRLRSKQLFLYISEL